MGKQNTIFDAEEFPGGPLVRGPRVSTAQGMGLTSGWGTKILYSACPMAWPK